jgi:hypothetical protein
VPSERLFHGDSLKPTGLQNTKHTKKQSLPPLKPLPPETFKSACGLLSHWPCHPILFLFHDFNTSNSTTLFTFPHSNPLTKSHDKKTNTNNNNDYDNELDTLVSMVYSHPDPLRAALSSDQPIPCRQDIVRSSKVSSSRLSRS